jgi:hypothetical protein
VIYHNWAEAGAWGPSPTDWESVGESTPGDVSAISWGPDRVDVFIHDPNNTIYQNILSLA